MKFYFAFLIIITLFLSVSFAHSNKDHWNCIEERDYLTIWEAYTQDLLELTVYGGDIHIINNADLPVVIDDYIVFLAPNLIANSSTQDGFLTPEIIDPHSLLVFHYGSFVTAIDDPYGTNIGIDSPYAGRPDWWCVETHQLSRYDVPLTLHGELAPELFKQIIEDSNLSLDQWWSDSGVLRNHKIWDYVDANPAFLIAKNPFSAYVHHTDRDVEYTLTVTNIGKQDGHDIIVRDVIPNSFTLKRKSFNIEPVSIDKNHNSDWVVTWILPEIKGYNGNYDPNGVETTEYEYEQIKYTVKARGPWKCPSRDLFAANVEWQDNNDEIQLSYSAGAVEFFEKVTN